MMSPEEPKEAERIGKAESTPTVCLVMIVRDEATILSRCLASVRPHIDAWVVCDTGSIDDTPSIVKPSWRAFPGRFITGFGGTLRKTAPKQ